MNLESDFQMLRDNPLMCLNMVLAEQAEDDQGLRRQSEFHRAISESIEIKKSSPFLEY